MKDQYRMYTYWGVWQELPQHERNGLLYQTVQGEIPQLNFIVQSFTATLRREENSYQNLEKLRTLSPEGLARLLLDTGWEVDCLALSALRKLLAFFFKLYSPAPLEWFNGQCGIRFETAELKRVLEPEFQLPECPPQLRCHVKLLLRYQLIAELNWSRTDPDKIKALLKLQQLLLLQDSQVQQFRKLAKPEQSGSWDLAARVKRYRNIREKELLLELAEDDNWRFSGVIGDNAFVYLDQEVTGSGLVQSEVCDIAVLPVGADGEPAALLFRPVLNREQFEKKYPLEHHQAAEDPETFIRFCDSRLSGTVPVAHNAQFDLRHLDHHYRRCASHPGRERYEPAVIRGEDPVDDAESVPLGRGAVDTIDLAVLLLPFSAGYSLQVLAGQLLNGEQQEHTAAADVKLLDRVCRKLLQEAAAAPFIVSLLSLLPRNYLLRGFIARFINLEQTAEAQQLDQWGNVFKALLNRLPATVEQGGTALPVYSGNNPGEKLDKLDPERCCAHPVFSDGLVRPSKTGNGRSEKQYRIFSAVSEHLKSRKTVIVEAGTGSGKTLGYLLPVFDYLNDNPQAAYIISTQSKMLQDQVEQTVREINQHRNKEIKTVTVKGKGNYLCLHRLWEAVESALLEKPDQQDSRLLIGLLYMFSVIHSSQQATPEPWDGCLDTLNMHLPEQLGVERMLRRQVAYHHRESLCPDCRYRSRCFVIRKLMELKDPASRLFIANASVVLTPYHSGEQPDEAVQTEQESSSFPDLLRRRTDNILFDEAHRIEESWYGVSSEVLEQEEFSGFVKQLQNIRSTLKSTAYVDELTDSGHTSQEIEKVLQTAGQLEKLLVKFAFNGQNSGGSLYGECRLLEGDVDADEFLYKRLFGMDGDRLILPLLQPDPTALERLQQLEQLNRRIQAMPVRVVDFKQYGLDNFRKLQQEALSVLTEENPQQAVFRPAGFLAALREQLENRYGLGRDKSGTDHQKKSKDIRLHHLYLDCCAAAYTLNRIVTLLQPLVLLRIQLQKKLLTRVLSYAEQLAEAKYTDTLSETVLALFLEGEGLDLVHARFADWLIGYPWEWGVEADHPASGGAEDRAVEAGQEELFSPNRAAQIDEHHLDKYTWKISLFNREPAAVIGRFMERFSRLALVSATMLVKDPRNGETDQEPVAPFQQPENFFLARYGLPSTTGICKINSPFDYLQQLKLFVPQHIPAPNGIFEGEHTVGTVLEQLRFLSALPELYPDYPQGTRALVLHTSRIQLEVTARLLREQFGSLPLKHKLDLVVQGEGSRRKLLERYLGEPGQAKMLLGMNSFGEGFDIVSQFHNAINQPGEAPQNPIKLLILPKIPFMNAADPFRQSQLRSYQRRDRLYNMIFSYQIKKNRTGNDGVKQNYRLRIQGKADSWFTEFYLPLSSINLHQWLGRLIRTPRDNGIAVVCDNRLYFESYGWQLCRPFFESGSGNTAPERYAVLNRYGQRCMNDLALWSCQQEALFYKLAHRLDLEQYRQFQPQLPGASPFAEITEIVRDAAAADGQFHRSAALIPAQPLATRIRLLLEEFGHTGNGNKLLSEVAARPGFEMQRALLPQNLQGAGGEPLVDRLQNWSLKKHSRTLYRQVLDILNGKPHPPVSRNLSRRGTLINLNRETTRLCQLMEQCDAPLQDKRNAWQFYHLLQALNSGVMYVFIVRRDKQNQQRIEVRTQYDYIRQLTGGGKDSFTVLRTSFGKSLCFQIPALLREGLTLVFVPTQSLLRDQMYKLKAEYPEEVDFLGGLSQLTPGRSEVLRRLERGDRRLRLLYLIPKQLCSPRIFQALLDHPAISLIVLDEFHLVDHWGRNTLMAEYNLVFQLYRQLCGLHQIAPTTRQLPRLAGFTATNDPISFEQLKNDFFYNLERCSRIDLETTVFNRPDITIEKVVVERPQERYAVIAEKIEALQPDEHNRVFIFCEYAGRGRYAGVIQVEQQLRERLPAESLPELFAYYQGAENRDDSSGKSLKTAPVLISTEALGMGIDLENVRHVINFDLPRSKEFFMQYMGRIRNRDPENDRELERSCTLLYCPALIEKNLQKAKKNPTTKFDLRFSTAVAAGKAVNLVYSNSHNIAKSGARWFHFRLDWLNSRLERHLPQLLLPLEKQHRRMVVQNNQPLFTDQLLPALWSAVRRSARDKRVQYLHDIIGQSSLINFEQLPEQLHRYGGRAAYLSTVEKFIVPGLLRTVRRAYGFSGCSADWLVIDLRQVLSTIVQVLERLAEERVPRCSIEELLLGSNENPRCLPFTWRESLSRPQCAGLLFQFALNCLQRSGMIRYDMQLTVPLLLLQGAVQGDENWKKFIQYYTQRNYKRQPVSPQTEFFLWHMRSLDRGAADEQQRQLYRYEEMVQIAGGAEPISGEQLRINLISAFSREEAEFLQNFLQNNGATGLDQP